MKVDAVLMAGSAKPGPDVAGVQLTDKPYLVLGGRSLVERAAGALLETPSVGRIYVVGDRRRLEEALSGLTPRAGQRLRLVEEGQGLVDSAYRAFFLNLLPDHGIQPPGSANFEPDQTEAFLAGQFPDRELAVLFVASDLPFVTRLALEEFIDRVPRHSALALGLVDHAQMESLLRAAGSHPALEHWKLGAIQLRAGAVRMNNLLLARPLLLDANLYRLVQRIYESRRVLRDDGQVDTSNWFSITRECLSYGRKATGGLRMVRGLANIAPMALFALLARKFSARRMSWLAWPFTRFLSEADLSFAAGLLLGSRSDLIMCTRPEIAVDIDVDDCYRHLAADDEAAFLAVQSRFTDCQ